MLNRRARARSGILLVLGLFLFSSVASILITPVPPARATSSYAAPYYLNNLSQAASGGSRQLASFVGSSGPVGSVNVGITTGNYPVAPSAAASTTTGTPSQSAQAARGYITVGQSPVGTINAGNWLFNMTLQDTRAAGTAYIWITVFSCNQQSIGRAAPAAPTCTFLLKNWDNSTNIKATQAPTAYTYTIPSVPQLTNVQVLYVEIWIHYVVDGGDAGDTITLNTGYGNNVAANDGASLKTPSATYWFNTPSTTCSSTCAVLSTATGSADASTKVTIGTTTGKYLVRPTVTSTTTGTPHSGPAGSAISCTNSTCRAGWLVLDNGFLGTNIASGTWTFNVALSASVIAGATPAAYLWISVLSCNVPNIGQSQIIITSSGQSGEVCKMVVKNWDNSTNLLTTTSTQSLTYTASGSAFSNAQYLDVEMWISYSSATSSSSQITFTVQDGSTSVALPSGNTYYATAQGSSCLNTCQQLFYYVDTQILSTSDNVATTTGKYQVRPSTGGTTTRGTPSISTPNGYAWITEGALNGTIRSGAWQFVTSLTDSAPGGTANLWFTVWNCARPNIGQTGAGCALLFKNWDNSTNVKSSGFGAFSYRTSSQPAFTNVGYLAIEVWISETATSGSSPDTITFHLGNSESFVELPGAQNIFYYTGTTMACAIECDFFSTTTGAANTATKVTIGTTAGVYRIKPYATSSTAASPAQQTTIGSGWETATPQNRNITSGTWRFNMTVADIVSQSGTATLWLKVYSCPTAIAGSPSTTGNCVFLFKNYDNSTNIKASSSATKYSFTTSTEAAFYNVQYLYVEYWVDYIVSSGTSGDQLTITTISSASSVETPATTGAALTGFHVASGKTVVSGTDTQQLRISTSNQNSLLYLSVSIGVDTIGFPFVNDNANLTWIFRSEKVGSSDTMVVFYAIAKPLLRGDVITVGSGISGQTAMSITVLSGEDSVNPFAASGSLVAATQTTTINNPTCTSSSCTLAYASNVAQNNLLVASLAYRIASSSCNTFTTATDTLGSTLAVVGTSSMASGSNCYESAIVAGYAGGTGSDTITLKFNGGTTPANQRGKVFELLGVSTSLDGTSAGSGTGASASTSGAISYNTNDFLLATFAGGATVTTLTAGAGFTICTANFRSDCEYQTALVSGSTNFPFTVAPNMDWSEAAAAFQAASSAQPSFAVGTNTAPNVQLTNTSPKVMVIGVVDAHTTSAPTAGSGFTLLATPVVAPSTITMATEFQALSTIQINLAVGFGLGSSVAWIQAGDAIQAAPVTQPIVLSVSPSGAPTATFAVSGCGLSASILGDGNSHTVTSAASCVLTVTAPVSAAHTRYVFSTSGTPSTTWSLTACSSGTCPTASNSHYYQLQNTYSVIANAQATFDSGLTFTIRGTYLGTAATTICGLSPASNASDTCSPASSWADYNTAVTLPTNPTGQAANSRWQVGGASSFTQTAGGNTNNVNYFKQWTDTFRGAANAQNTFDSGLGTITVTGTVLGTGNTAICTIIPVSGDSLDACSGYVDNANTPTVPTTLGNPPVNSQWKCGTCNFGSITFGGGTVTVNYYKQWTNTYSASTNGQGPPAWDSSLTIAPTGTSLGITGTAICTISPTSGTTAAASCSGYSDNSAAVTFPTLASGAGANIQWQKTGTSSFTDTSGGGTHTVAYYKQFTNTYQITPNAQPIWDTGLTGPVSGTQFGAGATICDFSPTGGSSSAASCSGYADYNTAATLPATLSGAPSSSRWSPSGTTSFTETIGGSTHSVSYYKQWTNSYAYSITGGGAGYSVPTFSYAYFGSASTSLLTTTLTAYWVDNSGAASVTNPLAGSTSFERWSIAVPIVTVTSGGGSTTYAFFHQYGCTCSYAVSNGGGPSAPAMSGIRYGSAVNDALSTTPGTIWEDDAASWSTTNPIAGTAGEQWVAASGTSGSVSAAFTVNPTYVHQYQITFVVSPVAAGNASPSGTLWEVAGSTVSVSVTQNAGYIFNVWSATGSIGIASAGSPSTTITVSSTGIVTANFGNTQPITLTVSPAGAPTITFTISGCGASPTTILGDGQAHNIDVTASCSLTVSYSNSGSARDVFGDGTSSWTITTCGGGLCTDQSSAYYYQLQNAYQITPQAQGTWDAGLSFTITGTVLGSASSTVCTINPVSGSGAQTCTAWVDYNTAVSFPANPTGAQANTRWQAKAPSSFSDNTASNTDNVNYYEQLAETVSYSISDALGSCAAPALTYASLGSSAAYTITTLGVVQYLDAGSSWSTPSPLAGSGSTEQCAPGGGSVTSGSAAAGGTINPSYVHQWSVTFAVSPVGTGTTSPAGTLWVNAGAATAVAATANVGYVFSSWSGPAGISFGSAGSASTTMTALASGTVTVVFVNGIVTQPITLTVSPSGSATVTFTITGCSPSPATIVGDGQPHSISVHSFCAPTIGYSNSGNTRYVFGDGTSSWTFTSCVSGTCSVQTSTYYLQYFLTVTGGNGITYSVTPQIGGATGWYNPGSILAVSSDGVYARAGGTGQRVAAYLIDGGASTAVAALLVVTTPSITMNGPHTVAFNSVTQFQVAFDSTTSSVLTQITQTPISGDSYWYDSGTQVTIGLNTIWGRSSGTGYRLLTYATNGATSGTGNSMSTFTIFSSQITSSLAITGTYTTQFYLTAQGGINISYSPLPPLVGDGPWFDAYTAVSVSSDWVGSSTGARKSIVNYQIDGANQNPVRQTSGRLTTQPITMNAPRTLSFISETQYLLTIIGGPAVSYLPPSTTNDGWYDSGTVVTVTTPTLWNIVPGQMRNAAVSYNLDGGANSSVSGPGTNSFGVLVTMHSAHALNIYSITQYDIKADCGTKGGNSGYAPLISYFSFGLPTQTILTLTPSDLWMDSGSSWTLPSVLGDSSTSERWMTQTSTGTATTYGTISAVYYHQYQFMITYALKGGGGSVFPPALSGLQFGAPYALSLGLGANTVWLDSSTSWSLTDPLAGSKATERWFSPTTPTGVVAAPASIAATYYHQYSVPFSYSTTGGGSPGAPTLTYSSAGILSAASFHAAPSPVWIDSDSTWTVTDPLPGSSSSERWSTVSASNTVSSSNPQNVAYFHQYALAIDTSIEGGGTHANPSLFSLEYGMAFSQTFAGNVTTFWLDRSAAWSITNPLGGSNSVERWITLSRTSGQVSSSSMLAITYYHQYSVSAAFSTSESISNNLPPVLTGRAMGSVHTFVLDTRPQPVWLDAGQSYSVTNPLQGSNDTVRWMTASSSGVVNRSVLLDPTYHAQYLEEITLTPSQGSSHISSANSLLVEYSQFGSAMTVSHNGTTLLLWVDSLSPVSISGSSRASSSAEEWCLSSTCASVSFLPDADDKTTYYYYDMLSEPVLGEFVGQATSVPVLYATAPSVAGGTDSSVPVSITLPSNQQVIWVSRGSKVSVPSILDGVAGERWWLGNTTAWTIGGPGRLPNPIVVYHQYALTVQISLASGVNVTSRWINSATSVILDANAPRGDSFESWTGTGVGSYSGTSLHPQIVLNGPITEIAKFFSFLGVVLDSTSGRVQQGGMILLTATISGEPQSVVVTARGLPAGVAAAFTQSLLSASPTGTNTVLALSVPETTAIGNYTLQVIAIAGNGMNASATYSMIVHGFTIIYKAVGLQTGTAWSIDLNGNVLVSKNATIRFDNVEAGNYSWSTLSPIFSLTGNASFVGIPQSGTIAVPLEQSKDILFTNLIPIIINVQRQSFTYTVLDKNFDVSAQRIENDGIGVTVSSIKQTGSRFIVIELSAAAFGGSADSYVVTVDGTRLSPAGSLDEMLKLNQMDVPHYYVLSTSYGMEMVLFIPHFSSHDLQIIPFVDVDKSTTVFTQLISTGGLALIPVVLLFALLFIREKRKNRREIKRRRTRLNASRAPAE